MHCRILNMDHDPADCGKPAFKVFRRGGSFFAVCADHAAPYMSPDFLKVWDVVPDEELIVYEIMER